MTTFAAPRLVIFDCDSTLSAIEGVDELARFRGPDMLAAAEAMTRDAMEGRLPVEAVFGRRLDLIRPTAAEVADIGRLYVETMEPSAVTTVATLRNAGWTPVILSGGFLPAIRPLADRLGIERVEAVDLYFDPTSGKYRGYDENYPTTRSGGKPIVVERLRTEMRPSRVVMVGDGVSDLETAAVVDSFVGFGRYVERERVKRGAHHYIKDLAELPAWLAKIAVN